MDISLKNSFKNPEITIYVSILIFIANFSNTNYLWGQTNSTYIALLNGTNVLPSVNTNASGIAEIVITHDPEGNAYQARYYLDLENISDVNTIDLHNAPEGINGTTIYLILDESYLSFYDEFESYLSFYDEFESPHLVRNEGSMELRGPLELFSFESSLGGKSNTFNPFIGSKPYTYEALERELRQNQTYVDVHTTKFRDGELRGQFHLLRQ